MHPFRLGTWISYTPFRQVTIGTYPTYFNKDNINMIPKYHESNKLPPPSCFHSSDGPKQPPLDAEKGVGNSFEPRVKARLAVHIIQKYNFIIYNDEFQKTYKKRKHVSILSLKFVLTNSINSVQRFFFYTCETINCTWFLWLQNIYMYFFLSRFEL